jgi:hypothetical protein
MKITDAGLKNNDYQVSGTIEIGDHPCLPSRTAYNAANVVRSGDGARNGLLKISSRGYKPAVRISSSTFPLHFLMGDVVTDMVSYFQTLRILSVLIIGWIPKAGR